jgi:type IX secretion system PorP/SprF family membrane protein
MKLRLFIILIGLININILLSQQDIQISQYMYNHLLTNPGSAGNNDMICVNTYVRQQWFGFEGAPQSYVANLDVPFNLLGASHGAGLTFIQDKWGFNTDINFKLSYALRVNVAEGKLGIGIYAGMNNWTLKPEWSATDDETTDASIPQDNPNEMAFDFGFGLFYRTEDLYIGTSVTHVVPPSFEYVSSGTGTGNLEMVRHFYLTAGYDLQLANPAYELKPSVFVKTDTKITSYDFNMTLAYNKKLWGGVTYRLTNTIIGMIGIDIFNGVKIGYAYDFDANSLYKYTSGTHEFTVNYCFKIGVEKSSQKYKSIRFL